MTCRGRKRHPLLLCKALWSKQKLRAARTPHGRSSADGISPPRCTWQSSSHFSFPLCTPPPPLRFPGDFSLFPLPAAVFTRRFRRCWNNRTANTALIIPFYLTALHNRSVLFRSRDDGFILIFSKSLPRRGLSWVHLRDRLSRGCLKSRDKKPAYERKLPRWHGTPFPARASLK